MNASQFDITKIGQDLVKTSKKQPEDSFPLSTRLFPYILVASRRMSYRAISSWLKEKYGVSLSAAAISRALSSPKLHLSRLAQSFIPRARYIGTVYGECNLSQLLYGEVCEDGPTELEVLARDTQNPRDEDDIPGWQELQDLARDWTAIPHEVRIMMRDYILNESEVDEDLVTIPDESDEY
jgi:hypothetical protein